MNVAHQVCIVDTSVANLASLNAAFKRLGCEPALTSDAGLIRTASHVVLPGVGAFGAAMKRLSYLGLTDVLYERIEQGNSTLAICLGMQLLCSGSDESPDVQGLGVVSARVQRFPASLQVPQLGWNEVMPQSETGGGKIEKNGHRSDRLREIPFASGFAYFANSYRLVQPPQGWGHALTVYGDPFVSAIWRDQVLACQFHPELSGTWGEELLKNWLADEFAITPMLNRLAE